MWNAMSDCYLTENTFYFDGIKDHHRKWGLLRKHFQYFLLCKYFSSLFYYILYLFFMSTEEIL